MQGVAKTARLFPEFSIKSEYKSLMPKNQVNQEFWLNILFLSEIQIARPNLKQKNWKKVQIFLLYKEDHVNLNYVYKKETKIGFIQFFPKKKFFKKSKELFKNRRRAKVVIK